MAGMDGAGVTVMVTDALGGFVVAPAEVAVTVAVCGAAAAANPPFA